MGKQYLREVMTPSPYTMPKTATLTEAAKAMRDKNIGGIVVTEQDGQVHGFITDRDIVVRGIALGHLPDATPIEMACSPEIAMMGPDDTIDDAVKLMAKKAIRRIPIVENGRAAGIVSVGDLAQARDERSALSGISAAQPNL